LHFSSNHIFIRHWLLLSGSRCRVLVYFIAQNFLDLGLCVDILNFSFVDAVDLIFGFGSMDYGRVFCNFRRCILEKK